MFRCSVLLCLSMILYSTTASPYKSWGDGADQADQDTRYHDFNEKFMPRLKEVEPIELQDLKEADIDTHMAIWKAMKQFRKQKNNKPEEDKDKLYHPSDVQDLVETYREPQYNQQGQLYQEAEKDLDDVYHNIRELAHHADQASVNLPEILVPDEAKVVELHKTSVYMTPEEDKDGLYHEDFIGQVFPVSVMEDLPKKVYTEPEEDLDHLFHS